MSKLRQLTVTALVLSVLAGCSAPVNKQSELDKYNEFKVQETDLVYTVEYGSKFDTDAARYQLMTNGMMTEDLTIHTNEVGEVELEVPLTNGKRKVKVLVVDTQKPIIEGKKEYSITEGDKLDFNTYLNAKDPVDGELKLEYTGFNNNKVGTQKVTATATDKNGNKTELELTIEVKKKPVVTRPPAYGGGSGNSGGSGSGNSGGSSGEVKPKPQPPVNASAAEKEMLRLVNIERGKIGVKQLSFNATLHDGARIRAKEITTKFSHTRPNGESPFSLPLVKGENISYGYPSAAAAVEGFMNSPGHRANILDSRWGTAAFGLEVENGIYYWVQLFGY